MQITRKTFAEIEPEILASGNYILKHMITKQNPRPFVLTKQLRESYELVCKYFFHDESFLKVNEHYSFSKGILLCGSKGTGKTIMMEIFSDLIYRRQKNHELKAFVIQDTHTIVRDFLINGFEVIEKYSSKHYYFRHGVPIGLCIDDLGMEDPNANSYGNKANVVEQILYERYKRMRRDGMVTHATTNCGAHELVNVYGGRVADRMVEMFNIITVDGKSLRR